MLRLFRFLRGYVTIKVWGYSPERFMNLCSNHNLLLWNVIHYKDYYVMNISIRGFFQLRPIARKTRTKVVIIQKYGLPFFVHRVKKRSIFLLGIVGCFSFLLCMSNYIWSIEVIGNTSISCEEVLDYLDTKNIRYGTLKSSIQPDELKKDIRLSFENVIWDSVKIEGTKLSIEIKEGIGLEPQAETLESPTDIIANRDGKIVKMVTRKGIPNFKTGDTVSMNQVVVSGLIPITGEDETVQKYQYCNADADIYLETIYPYEDRIPKSYTRKEFVAETQTLGVMEIMGKEIMLPHRKITHEKYDSFTEMKQMKILDNFYLPFYFGKKTIRGYKNVTVNHSDREAEKIASEHLAEFITSLEEKGVQIIKKDVKIKKETKSKKVKLMVQGNIIVVEKIGKNMPSEIKETVQTLPE